MSNCTCQSREIEWKKKKIERDYTVDFCHKPLTQKGATKQKVALEIEFLNWFFVNASPHIELSPTPTIKDKQLTQNETAKTTNLINLEDNVR
ncbi:300_t:CDS:2, partial [Rhizophagus irregularis]